MRALFGMLLAIGLLFSIANVTTEGGNVTSIYFNQTQNSTSWDGLYGDVVLGAGATYTHTVNGNAVVLLNMVAQDPPCIYSSISMHVVAANNSAITLPLSAGNLAQLDGFIGGSQNGSSTFTGLDTFVLNSGTYNNVPTAYSYANGAPSPDFREGYLNDAVGNLVFVADVVDNRPNWNGSTSDYQIMLPNNGAPVQYWLWVDVNYTCVSPTPPDPHHKDHKLFIPPIDSYSIVTGEEFSLELVVENRGDYKEEDVEVYISECPEGFSCGSGFIDSIKKGDEENASLLVSVGLIGSYVLEVCAENDDADYCREFFLQVLPECEEGEGCPGEEYCEGGYWVPKKEAGEECGDGCWCLSGICENGVCVLCETDDDCEDDEECSGGYCEEIECPCGVVENHACLPHECCSDGDCETGEFCIGLECVPKELEIVLVDGELVVGEEGHFQILNNKGDEVPFADVFTNKESTVADEFGHASLPFSADGIVYADGEGYPQAAKMFSVLQLASISLLEGPAVAGKESTIEITDQDGMPIAGADVILEGNVLVSDENGQVKYAFSESGFQTISATKQGYRISDAEIEVAAAGVEIADACKFPVVLSWIEVAPTEFYWLWLLSLVLGTFNFIVLRKRIGRDFLKKLKEENFGGEYGAELARKRREIYYKSLAYSYGPLLLALPGIPFLNICFMSNVVVLQAVGELALIIKKIVEKRG
ncbi:hypothetical protein GF412_00710 [Candidatus Micrarchaeota archaeon]|nr:hypothetical protein [Candidatus Micrarchaeota archaeon]MBD3417494.1 hypothetical protein [Candidatus Micrarchaeota archaeon]